MHLNYILPIGFLDENKSLQGTTICGCPVFSFDKLEELKKQSKYFIVATGDNIVRRRLFDTMVDNNFVPVSIVHRKAVVSSMSTLGKGTYIGIGAVVNTNAVVKDNVLITTSATIDHDCIIEDDVLIAPGVHLAGGVKIGRGALIGIGTVIIPDITIGENSIIGAGSVVTKDIPPHVKAFGVPSKVVGDLC